MAAELTVTAAVPEDVSVTTNDFVVPSLTLPKASVVALRVSCDVVATPVPVSAIVEVVPEVALLVIVILPVTAPAVAGANVTGIDKVCPGDKVFGKPVAPKVNPVPVIAAELTVTAAVPEEVSVTANDFVAASLTLPKASVVALRVSCDVVATPIPVSAIVEVVPEAALLVIVILPVTAPAVLGANVTGIDRVCPGANVLGKPVVPRVNPVPVIVAELTVTAAVPEEVSVTASAFDVASVTLPKARVVALSVS
jgi:hypothetical protein